MKRSLSAAALALSFAAVGSTHVISMSTGDLRIEGRQVHYELRMPLYEMPHVAPSDPARSEQSLLEHIRFSSSGIEGKLVHRSCRAEPGQAVYSCVADYEFPQPVDQLDIVCTFHVVTVPNHVHLVRAVMGDRRDQAIFDSFQKATLRFRPPTAAEVAITEFGAGAMRAVGGLVQLLFLASLVLAARTRRELIAISGMFLLGQIGSALIVPRTAWQPPARFVEAAAALSLAYLAIEILLLPKAGARWVIAGLLGTFHGLYFHLFLESTGYAPGFVLAGAVVVELALIAAFAFLFFRIGRLAHRGVDNTRKSAGTQPAPAFRTALKPLQLTASVLLVVGMVWFFLRLKG